MIKVLQIMRQLAKLREDATAARLKGATGQLQQAQMFQEQINNYVQEYGQQMMEQAREGTNVAYLQMSGAFREKLASGAAEQQKQVVGLTRAVDLAKHEVIKAQVRGKGIQDFLDKKLKEQRLRQEKVQQGLLEDALTARFENKVGTKDA